MIATRLTLRNFQRHRRLVVRLGRELSVIVGPTDSGKSAVIRALRWLVTNQPSGEAFRRHGAAWVSVTLRFSDGTEVIRYRGKRGNRYEIRKDRKRQVYRAFKTTPPDDVVKLLRMSDLNFQAQFDRPFWFGDSAPEVSRSLNAIVDLGVIDASLSEAASRVREASSRVSLTEERLKEARTSTKSLGYVRQMDAELRQVEEFHNGQIEPIEAEITSLATLVERVQESRRVLRSHRDLPDPVLVTRSLEHWQKQEKQCALLAEAIDRIVETER